MPELFKAIREGVQKDGRVQIISAGSDTPNKKSSSSLKWLLLGLALIGLTSTGRSRGR